jgi:hypothetical protein
VDESLPDKNIGINKKALRVVDWQRFFGNGL